MGISSKSELRKLEKEATTLLIKSAREDDLLLVNYLHSGSQRSNTCKPQKTVEPSKVKKTE